MSERHPTSRLWAAILILIFCTGFGVSVYFSASSVFSSISSAAEIIVGVEGAALRLPSLAALTGLFTAFISLIGTVSTIILAWRADRRSTRESERSARESDLKLIQMVQQIEGLKRKLDVPATSEQERV
jgi:hypothetical protein